MDMRGLSEEKGSWKTICICRRRGLNALLLKVSIPVPWNWTAPSLDIKRSGTRREDKLMGRKDLSRVWLLRKLLDEMTNVEAMEFLLGKLGHTKSNREFLDSMST